MGTAGESRRAVVLLYSGCTIAEVVELTTRLTDGGVAVAHAAPNLDAVRDRSGLLMQPDVRVGDLDASVVDVVIVPGGDPATIIDDREVLGLLDAVVAADGFVAGICAGVLVMAAAGLVRGRSITHNYRSPWAPAAVSDFVHGFWDGAHVEPDPAVGVVVDMPIITALPNATIDFAMEVCCRLGIYTTERAWLMARDLRGEFVTELLDQ